MEFASRPYRACVGLMIFNQAGLVWIGRRTGSMVRDRASWWQMPQGGVDAGETPAAAAMRELDEETGIRTARIIAESRDWHPYDLPVDLARRLWGGRYRGQTQKWFAIRFEGEDAEIDISQVDQEPEFEAWRWATIDEALTLIVPFKRPVYELVIEEFRPLLMPSSTGKP